MIVNSKKMLEKAKQGKYAVAQFNINNLEWTRYILEKCNELGVDVILGVSEGAIKYMGGYSVVVDLIKALVKDLNITSDVCIHLDHGSSVEACKKAIDAGFSSVMIDASKFELDKNIEITKEVVEYAHERDITVEAEVGHINGNEDGVSSIKFNATIEECEAIVKGTGIDSLAPALGSVHGLYKGEPDLDFETMKEISDKLDLPLVLHGGSGIGEEDIKKAISCGICKININTELQIVWHDAVVKFIEENPNTYDPRKVISSGKDAIYQMIEYKVNLFYNK